MKTSILAIATGLSDKDLLARLAALAGREREVLVELLAHLAALDSRPSVYAAQGHGSLFRYCTEALRLSEDAACTRIDVARTCRRLPVILDLLASGEGGLTSVRMLGRHLTLENHEAVLARTRGRSRPQIEALVAELAPQPDVPSTVRKLPAFTVTMSSPTASMAAATGVSSSEPAPAPATFVPAPRPIVRASAPERYRVQFTIGTETHEKLRRVQGLLRREIPDGDPGVIFDRAISLPLEKVEKAKLGATARPRSIRFGTDRTQRSRTPARAVKRDTWKRDTGQCAFVSPSARRCSERVFLEFHHVLPHAYAEPWTWMIPSVGAA